jgi:hypothetical protein
LILVECLIHCKYFFLFSLGSACDYFTIFDIKSYVTSIFDFSLDIAFIVIWRAYSNYLCCFIILSSPKEWSFSVRNELIKHIKCSISPLILCINPMFNSSLFSVEPIRDRTNISGCKNILIRSLHEWIAFNCTLII